MRESQIVIGPEYEITTGCNWGMRNETITGCNRRMRESQVVIGGGV